MIKRDDVYLNWWIETSRMWIIRAYGTTPEGFSTEDFGELLCHNLHERNMGFRHIAVEWNLSLECLAELVADHIRRLE